jgi:hypothetical protein
MTPKDVWIQNVIEFLKQIASAEFQEKGWVRNEIHDYCTFVETMCGLFDDSNFEDFIDNKAANWGYTDEQIKKLDKLRHALNAFDAKHGCYEDPALIVKDPEWLKIREMAKDVLKSLGIEKYLDPSKELIRYCLLDTIKDISRSDYQEKYWMKLRKPDSNSYEEVMKKFFQIYKAQALINHYKEYEITENQLEKLIKLYEALKAYREKKQDVQDLREIINDPEWHQIRALAGEVVKVFEYKS